MFNKVLLYRKRFIAIKLINKCAVPIFWSLSPYYEIDNQISYEPEKGYLHSWTEEQVTFCYNGQKVNFKFTIKTCVIYLVFKNLQIGHAMKSTLQFNFYSRENSDLLYSDTVTVSGETYDVLLDIEYANPIEFKFIRVNDTMLKSFLLKNRGPYEIKFV